MNILWKPVPNFEKGRRGHLPLAVVIHIAEGTALGTFQEFSAPQTQKSSHYLVCANGNIWQFCKEQDSAWANGTVYKPTADIIKAGISANPNSITISIEHEGFGAVGLNDMQYNASAQLVSAICSRWNIPLDRKHVIRHNEINAGKSCPGNVSVEKLIALAQPVPDPPLSRIQEIIASIQALINLFAKGRRNLGAMSMSTTYIGIYVMLLGALLQWLGVPIVQGELETTIKVALEIVGALLAMWGRYRIGGVTVLGGRKV